MICKTCGEDKKKKCFSKSYTMYTKKSTGRRVKVYYRRGQCKTCRNKGDKERRLTRLFEETQTRLKLNRVCLRYYT